MCALALAFEVSAATVSGSISFVTKRGQSPVAQETLVWVEPAGTKPAKPAKKSPATFQVLTRSKALLPHVLAVPAGSTVIFPNEDPIAHNLFAISGGNAFDLGIYRRGPGKSQRFENAGVVNVYCNVHPNMSAVIHVMNAQSYVFADPTGTFSITGLAPGKYTLIAWNEQGGTVRTSIDVPASGLAGIAVTLDSRSFRAVPHMNKEGKPYRAPSSRDY